jgi:SAM-dependent methyltransferase
VDNTAPRAGLPIPPFEMRQLVGPTDEAAFTNPSRDPIFSDLAEEQFDSVVDFGCGCGRLARQMIEQRARPRRYLGFDLHSGMVRWCQRELASHASGFEFRHHDVYNVAFNPGPDKPLFLPMPADSESASLMIALSVFTHTTQVQTEHYLREAARVLRPDGVLVASWFLFEKRFFPMMHDFQNTLYINIEDPTNATIFDREWLQLSLRNLGLVVVKAVQPSLRGYQWLLYIRRITAGYDAITMPQDTAPFGRLPPPIPIMDPAKVGL